MVIFLEVRRLLQYTYMDVDSKEISYNFINNKILNNGNKLIPRLFNKIWVILSNISSDSRPTFYDSPQTIDFVVGNQSYSGEIIKKLNTTKIKGIVYEVRIDQHPEYHRILFFIQDTKLVSFILFTFGFTKTHSIQDIKTNYYCLLSNKLQDDYRIHKKGVDYQ